MQIKDKFRLVVAIISLLLGLLTVFGVSNCFSHDLEPIFLATGCAFIGFFVPAFGASVFSHGDSQNGKLFWIWYLIIYWSKLIVFPIFFYALVHAYGFSENNNLLIVSGSLIIGMSIDSIKFPNVFSKQ